jgi:uncharacterized protein YjeT (DUF2065 family)
MEASVQLFAAINFLVIGLSHIFAPRAWADFFDLLRQKGEPGVFVVGFMSLLFGSIVAAFHNVWSGLPVVLTVIGWAQVFKALIYFAFPSFGLRRLGAVPPERAHLFVYGGFFSIALAGLFFYLFATS